MSGKKSPGSKAGMSPSGRRWKNEQRHKRGEDEARAQMHELRDQRAGAVYRTDVPFAEPEPAAPMPKPGTLARAKLIARVAELKAEGKTHLAICIELNITSVSQLLKEWKSQQEGTP